MSNAVIDTTVVALSNCDLALLLGSETLRRRIGLIRRCNEGAYIPRYNYRLLSEYCAHVRSQNNDVIVVFFNVLSTYGVLVERNTLRRQEKAVAVQCRWPGHDDHLLAAAICDEGCNLFVTENALAICGQRVRRELGVAVVKV